MLIHSWLIPINITFLWGNWVAQFIHTWYPKTLHCFGYWPWLWYFLLFSLDIPWLGYVSTSTYIAGSSTHTDLQHACWLFSTLLALISKSVALLRLFPHFCISEFRNDNLVQCWIQFWPQGNSQYRPLDIDTILRRITVAQYLLYFCSYTKWFHKNGLIPRGLSIS